MSRLKLEMIAGNRKPLVICCTNAAATASGLGKIQNGMTWDIENISHMRQTTRKTIKKYTTGRIRLFILVNRKQCSYFIGYAYDRRVPDFPRSRCTDLYLGGNSCRSW